MDVLMICIFACWGLMVFCFICYKEKKKNIIRDQDKEIATLKTHKRRLQAALRGSRFVTTIVTSKDPVKNPKAIVKPDFREW